MLPLFRVRIRPLSLIFCFFFFFFEGSIPEHFFVFSSTQTGSASTEVLLPTLPMSSMFRLFSSLWLFAPVLGEFKIDNYYRPYCVIPTLPFNLVLYFKCQNMENYKVLSSSFYCFRFPVLNVNSSSCI